MTSSTTQDPLGSGVSSSIFTVISSVFQVFPAISKPRCVGSRSRRRKMKEMEEEEEKEIRRKFNRGQGITGKYQEDFNLVFLPALPFSVTFRVFWVF